MKWIMYNDSIHPVNQNVEVLNDIVEAIKLQNAVIQSLIERIKCQQEYIHDIYQTIYELAPEYEVIETMAEDDEEKRRMLDLYLNHCDDYVEKMWEK